MEILRRPAQWIARLGPVFLFLWTILGGLSAPCWAADASLADKLKSRLVFEIDDLRTNVDVTAQADNRLVVTLRGDVDTDGEKRRILTQADGVVADSGTIRDRIFVKSPGESEAPEPETTDLWVLTYIRSRVSSASGDGTLTTAAPDSVDTLVQTLNSVYGQPIVRRAGGGRLFLHGKQSQVLAVKRFLSLIDSPWPQVQMNMWAIQVSGSPDEVSHRTQAIGEQIRAVRDRMEDVQRELAHIVVRTDDPNDPEWWKNLADQFETAGIELHAKGSLSLNEALLLLVLHPRRDQKVKALQAFVQAQCGAWECQENHSIPFHRLADILKDSYDEDLESFLDFRNALYCFKDKARWPLRPDAPRSLVRTGATVDRVLKAVTDAFSADMNDLFLDPLLRRVQKEGTSRSKGDGVALVGRTRIVVTSGLEAGLEPEMASFVESGRPKPFGKELLDLAFPASESGDGTQKDKLTGASKVLAGLSGAQALGLAAVLSADTEPAYTKVAPGIALSVRPTVLPDGGAARLTVDARFGVASTPLDQGRTDIWRAAPPAGIASHNIHTDAVVSAFDLFDISSFSVTVSHPQTPFYIPILGRLPILGPAFQIPRRNKETLFESIVLVNTVILPRSVELHRFYGRDVSPRQNPEIDCREEPAAAARAGG
ncbi:MAG TPA: BON domain-containing protein [Thermoanaerobaculia bacterium]|jgi:hypothetical protein